MKVVIDTNVIVSALLKSDSIPALIVSLILQKHIKVCLSSEIFIEYTEVFNYKKLKALNHADVQDLLLSIKENALWFSPKESIEIIKDDPDDNKFLECAFEAQADFFITGNTKHFTIDTFHQIQIVKPKQFLDIVSRELFE